MKKAIISLSILLVISIIVNAFYIKDYYQQKKQLNSLVERSELHEIKDSLSDSSDMIQEFLKTDKTQEKLTSIRNKLYAIDMKIEQYRVKYRHSLSRISFEFAIMSLVGNCSYNFENSRTDTTGTKIRINPILEDNVVSENEVNFLSALYDDLEMLVAHTDSTMWNFLEAYNIFGTKWGYYDTTPLKLLASEE